MNVLALNNRVRFTLKSKELGSISIDEPIGWKTDDKEYTRNETYHGIFINMSNNLTFVGNASDYIELVYETEGILAELRLTREERHPVTDDWTMSYSGYLDMSTYQKEKGRVKMKFNSGGVEAVLKARENEMVEIDREDTIDGNILADLSTEVVRLDGRDVFLETIWKYAPMSYYKELKVGSSDGNTRNDSNTLPFDIFKNSHEHAQITADGLNGNDGLGQSTMMLLLNIDRKRTFNVNLSDVKFHAYSFLNGKINNGYVSVALAKYTYNGSEYIIKTDSIITTWRLDLTGSQIPSKTYSIPNNTYEIELNSGESLGLRVLLRVDFAVVYNGAFREYQERDFFYKLESGKITVREDSQFILGDPGDPSNDEYKKIKAVTPFYLSNRLIEIITNKKNIVKSNVLENGLWKDLLLTHGFWIRNFSRENDANLPEDERRFKPFTTSFKDFMTSMSAVVNLGVGIESNRYEEKIIIEELRHFYNQNVTIKLPNPVKNIKRSIDPSKFYKSVEIGFEKGGEYEEAMGLDEFNVRNTYTTCISNVKNSYNQLSKYRADSYGVEFARRKPFELYSTEDTSYDQDVFFLDCRPFNDVYITRKYGDDFTSIPTGVFSPETAYNLRLSPFNSMLRHGWVVSSGLTKYPNFKVKYASSTGNSSLKTIYSENGEIQNTQLQRARYIPEIVEFTHEVDFDLSQKLSGNTNINGELITNVYGLVEFINEKGVTERGFLLSVKPNGEGKWRLLKSTR